MAKLKNSYLNSVIPQRPGLSCRNNYFVFKSQKKDQLYKQRRVNHFGKRYNLEKLEGPFRRDPASTGGRGQNLSSVFIPNMYPR